VLARTTIARFRERPAAQWGAEYSAFLGRLGTPHLSATVLLPRPEVVVRQMALRGVESKDLEAAIAFQLDGINPYGDQEVLFGWTRLDAKAAYWWASFGARSSTATLELFTEAGVANGCFTFVAAAIHGAIRLDRSYRLAISWRSAKPGDSGVEVYGESQSPPGVLGGVRRVQPRKAAAMAAAELRLAPDTAPMALESLLPAPARESGGERSGARSACLTRRRWRAPARGWRRSANSAASRAPRIGASRGIFVPSAVAAAAAADRAGRNAGMAGLRRGPVPQRSWTLEIAQPPAASGAYAAALAQKISTILAHAHRPAG
jgi:hypothetical protein